MIFLFVLLAACGMSCCGIAARHFTLGDMLFGFFGQPRKAREVHPDKQPNPTRSTSNFHEVSAAYEAVVVCICKELTNHLVFALLRPSQYKLRSGVAWSFQHVAGRIEQASEKKQSTCFANSCWVGRTEFNPIYIFDPFPEDCRSQVQDLFLRVAAARLALQAIISYSNFVWALFCPGEAYWKLWQQQEPFSSLVRSCRLLASLQ